MSIQNATFGFQFRMSFSNVKSLREDRHNDAILEVL